MSAYGTYLECNNVCLCPKCSLRGLKCAPCMDCTGETKEVPEEDYCNGCITKCDLFRGRND